MKKTAIMLFLIAMIGVASAYDCNNFIADQNGTMHLDSTGSIKLCNWNDLNVLIADNNQLDQNNQQLLLDNNILEYARDQYFNELQTARAETNIYKPKVEELDGKLGECNTAKATAEAKATAAEEQNTKLGKTIFTQLDNLGTSIGEIKTTTNAAVLLISDVNEGCKKNLESCQANYNTLSAENMGIGALVLIGVAYILTKIIRKIRPPKKPIAVNPPPKETKTDQSPAGWAKLD